MKHVREPLPDVQRRRPEISAALAAVIERATAKETRNRYATVDAMVHDLEQVLAIEAARTGETSGEATAVLRSLPSDTADFAPGRLRHPRRALIASVLVLAVAAGLIAWFATRTERGPGEGATPKTPGLSTVNLDSDAASDYDPQGDGEESPEAARNAIDGNLTTNWDTETYSGGFAGSNKSGVGLYVDAGQPIRARQLDLVTATPGFQAEVYAANTIPGQIRDWTSVAPRGRVAQEQRFRLDTDGTGYRYYLLWIVELPEDNKADVQELSLKR
jgi:serine/threonine-protein kinase